jgi:ACR3 family arsenite efflux pump ArsB
MAAEIVRRCGRKFRYCVDNRWLVGSTVTLEMLVWLTVVLAIGLLIMVSNIRSEALHHSFQAKTMWIQVQLNLVTNWIVEPLAMVALLKHL